jgi:hypothetical protein
MLPVVRQFRNSPDPCGRTGKSLQPTASALGPGPGFAGSVAGDQVVLERLAKVEPGRIVLCGVERCLEVSDHRVVAVHLSRFRGGHIRRYVLDR